MITFFESVIEKWKNFRPPIIPSRGEIDCFRKQIMKVRGKRALVLGATPQFRDLLHSLHFEVTVADVSQKMISGLRYLMCSPQKPEREIVDNWLNLGNYPDTYDVILGDWVIGNLPDFYTQERLCVVMHKILTDGGYFITRHHYNWDPPKTVEQLVEEYKNADSDERCGTAFEFILQSLCGGNYIQDTMVSKEIIEQAIRAHPQHAPFMEKCLENFSWVYLSSLERKRWYYGPREELEKMFKRYFTIKDVVYGNDHRWVSICPLYVLKKERRLKAKL